MTTGWIRGRTIHGGGINRARQAHHQRLHDLRMALSDLPIEVRRQLVIAALDLTRLRAKARKAVLLVLVDHKRQIDAAKEIRRLKQFVNTALRIVRPKLAEVEAYFESLSSGKDSVGR